jgi:hypothetical protein
MAGDINKDPFFVIDDSGSLQNLLVVKRGNGANERVLPYSLAELVSSSVDVNNFGVLTSSIKDISSSLASISSSTGVSSSLEQIYGQLTASYRYATASYNQLTASSQYLSSISGSISSSNILLGDISSSQANIYEQLTASYDYATGSYDQLTASNEYLSSISGTLSSSYLLLSDISSSDALIYNTATASYDQLTASYNELTASNLTLININDGINTLTSSADVTYNYLTSSIDTITASLSQSTNYIRQLASYARATAVRSTILDLPTVQATIDLATRDELIPGGVGNAEEYLRACVDVLIQNSTNKHCYVKISHLPEATVAADDYTIKLPPGVIYNSDSQLASMRHVVYVSESADVGEVSAMLTYNTTLLTDAAYPPLVGPNTIYSLAVNLYDFYDSRTVANEWRYESQDIYNKFTITGQARVNEGPSQYFDIYITPAGSSERTGSVTIDSSTAQDFSIEVCNPANGNYELIIDCTAGGLDKRGDGRILFADVLIQSSSACAAP